MWNMTVKANCHLARISALNDVSYFRAKGTGGTRGFSPVPSPSGCDEHSAEPRAKAAATTPLRPDAECGASPLAVTGLLRFEEPAGGTPAAVSSLTDVTISSFGRGVITAGAHRPFLMAGVFAGC
jgi:hypothetical protein